VGENRSQTSRACLGHPADRLGHPPKPLKVDKTAFDDVLRKLAHSGPVKKSEAKTEKTKPGKIISPQK